MKLWKVKYDYESLEIFETQIPEKIPNENSQIMMDFHEISHNITCFDQVEYFFDQKGSKAGEEIDANLGSDGVSSPKKGYFCSKCKNPVFAKDALYSDAEYFCPDCFVNGNPKEQQSSDPKEPKEKIELPNEKKKIWVLNTKSTSKKTKEI